jgi:hypothetical protein
VDVWVKARDLYCGRCLAFGTRAARYYSNPRLKKNTRMSNELPRQMLWTSIQASRADSLYRISLSSIIIYSFFTHLFFT